MAKLKIEDISNELKIKGWLLMSIEYKNLDSELHMECPEGHQVYLSYGKWRKNFDCPTCKANPLKIPEQTVIYKRPGAQRVLGLDDATTTTGWSIFDDGKLIKYGKITMNHSTEVERICSIKQWLISMIANWEPSTVGIEDIQLQKFGEKDGDNIEGVLTFKTLAHLQGVLINACYEKKIPFEIVNVATWRKHCGVLGKTKADKKRSAQLKVKEWYDISVSNDEADAICIGKFISETKRKKIEKLKWE